MKVCCLANPYSKGLRKNERMVEKLKDWATNIVPVTVTLSLSEIKKAATQCLEEGTDVVVLASGDGGIHYFITAFIKAYRELKEKEIRDLHMPVFAPLKLGTANIISRSLGLAQKPKRFVKKIVSKIEKVASRTELPIIKRHPLKIFDGKEDKYGFVFGNGGIYQFFKEYYRDRNYGILRFLKIFVHFVVSLFTGSHYVSKFTSPVKARLYLEEKIIQLKEYKAIVSSSIEAKVVFLRAFKNAHLLGKLCVYAGNPGRLTLLRLLSSSIFGKHPKGKNVISEMTSSLKILTEEKIGYVIDGELYSANYLHISRGPALEFFKS